MRLSIIIPAYNADAYLPDLLACLDKQMVPGVEVIIVDDGSKIPFKTDYKWATVIRQENAGPGIARNTGMDAMTGEYFTFIDSDDLVADNYISTILHKIETEAFDYCYLSWRTTNTESVKKWRSILGDTTPTHSYKPAEGVSVQVTHQYKDLQLNRLLPVGEIIIVDEDRAEALVKAGYGRRI